MRKHYLQVKKKIKNEIKRNRVLYRITKIITGNSVNSTKQSLMVTNRRELKALQYAIENSKNPIEAVNYFLEILKFDSKTLFKIIKSLHEQRSPAYDELIEGVEFITSLNFRMLLTINNKYFNRALLTEKQIDLLIEEYREAQTSLESERIIKNLLVSIIIDKASVSDVECWLLKIGVNWSALSNHQSIKLLSRISSENEKELFHFWKKRLLPSLSPAAKVKAMMYNATLQDDKNYEALEKAFCELPFEVSRFYKEHIKPIFDIIPQENNYLNARFDRTQVQAIQNIILDSIRNSNSLAFMRLGDGESYGFIDNNFLDSRGLKRQELHWWGVELGDELRAELRNRYYESVHGSDFLGVPSVLRLIRDFNLGKSDSYEVNSLISRILCVMNASQAFIETKKILEDQSNLYLFDHSFMKAICTAARRVYVISGLNSKLLPDWGGHDKTEYIEIPTHKILRNTHVASSIEGIFPYVYEKYLDKVSTLAEPGIVFLFSAGFIGKILIGAAAKNGAVALDIGQILVSYALGNDK